MNEGTAAAVKNSNSSNNGGRVMLSYNIVLRTMAFCFTLIAAVVAGVNFETKNIPVKFSDQLPPFNIKVTAKWHYLSSTLFMVVADSIACSYSFGSIIVSILSHNKKMQTRLLLLISDLIMVVLLFSANGAATSVGLIGLKGNPHIQWQKVCYMFKKYCHQGAASIAMSYIGSFAFLWLVVFAIMNLHKKSS